jgi:hypothetical protein
VRKEERGKARQEEYEARKCERDEKRAEKKKLKESKKADRNSQREQKRKLRAARKGEDKEGVEQIALPQQTDGASSPVPKSSRMMTTTSPWIFYQYSSPFFQTCPPVIHDCLVHSMGETKKRKDKAILEVEQSAGLLPQIDGTSDPFQTSCSARISCTSFDSSSTSVPSRSQVIIHQRLVNVMREARIEKEKRRDSIDQVYTQPVSIAAPQIQTDGARDEVASTLEKSTDQIHVLPIDSSSHNQEPPRYAKELEFSEKQRKRREAREARREERENRRKQRTLLRQSRQKWKQAEVPEAQPQTYTKISPSTESFIEKTPPQKACCGLGAAAGSDPEKLEDEVEKVGASVKDAIKKNKLVAKDLESKVDKVATSSKKTIENVKFVSNEVKAAVDDVIASGKKTIQNVKSIPDDAQATVEKFVEDGKEIIKKVKSGSNRSQKMSKDVKKGKKKLKEKMQNAIPQTDGASESKPSSTKSSRHRRKSRKSERKPSAADVPQRLLSFVKDPKANCDSSGPCFGYSDPCGSECRRNVIKTPEDSELTTPPSLRLHEYGSSKVANDTQSYFVPDTKSACDSLGPCRGYSEPCGNDCQKQVAAKFEPIQGKPLVSMRSGKPITESHSEGGDHSQLTRSARKSFGKLIQAMAMEGAPIVRVMSRKCEDDSDDNHAQLTNFGRIPSGKYVVAVALVEVPTASVMSEKLVVTEPAHRQPIARVRSRKNTAGAPERTKNILQRKSSEHVPETSENSGTLITSSNETGVTLEDPRDTRLVRISNGATKPSPKSFAHTLSECHEYSSTRNSECLEGIVETFGPQDSCDEVGPRNEHSDLCKHEPRKPLVRGDSQDTHSSLGYTAGVTGFQANGSPVHVVAGPENTQCDFNRDVSEKRKDKAKKVKSESQLRRKTTVPKAQKRIDDVNEGAHGVIPCVQMDGTSESKPSLPEIEGNARSRRRALRRARKGKQKAEHSLAQTDGVAERTPPLPATFDERYNVDDAGVQSDALSSRDFYVEMRSNEFELDGLEPDEAELTVNFKDWRVAFKEKVSELRAQSVAESSTSSSSSEDTMNGSIVAGVHHFLDESENDDVESEDNERLVLVKESIARAKALLRGAIEENEMENFEYNGCLRHQTDGVVDLFPSEHLSQRSGRSIVRRVKLFLGESDFDDIDSEDEEYLVLTNMSIAKGKQLLERALRVEELEGMDQGLQQTTS